MAIPFIALGVFRSPRSYPRRPENERALRVSTALPGSALPPLLLCGIVVCALGAVELAVVHFT